MTTLLLSDIHANRPALDAVLAAESGFEDVVFLGDAVDCGPAPNVVVDRLRELNGQFVLGNHDRAVLDSTSYDSDDNRSQWQCWTRCQLSPQNIRFLESNSNSMGLTRHGHTVRVHHGNFPIPPDRDEADWTERLYEDTSRDIFAALAERYPESYVLHGHTHRQFVREVDGTTFVNPGTVGLQRPGCRQDVAHYAVLDEDGFELRSVSYNLEQVCDAMLSVDLPDEFIQEWNKCFRTGEGPRPH